MLADDFDIDIRFDEIAFRHDVDHEIVNLHLSTRSQWRNRPSCVADFDEGEDSSPTALIEIPTPEKKDEAASASDNDADDGGEDADAPKEEAEPPQEAAEAEDRRHVQTEDDQIGGAELVAHVDSVANRFAAR